MAALYPFTAGLVSAYTHPGIPLTSDDLKTLKSNLNVEPWKTGYAALSSDWRSQLTYTMQGPFTVVSRNPNSNLNEWRNDMTAIHNLAYMWYFTGNTNYAQKARDILIAWANTQTNFNGGESGLDLGDYAYKFAGGASILRGTWPGWTQADTDAVKNLFGNVYWWATTCPSVDTQGPSNKGTLNMAAGLAIAAFCDDTAKFDKMIARFRTSASAGFPNMLPTGEMGETGRDQGHAYGNLVSTALFAEIAWKQGVDLYSELDNRLLACGEYYARNNVVTNTPYIAFGTTDAFYWNNSGGTGGSYPANAMGLWILRGAYNTRKGLSTPWMDKKIAQQVVYGDNFMFCKSADVSTATSPAALTLPSTTSVTTGFSNVDIGTATPAGGGTYSGGTWTVQGGGTDIWTHGNDSGHFTYKQVTGDCAIIAKITSISNSAFNAKAGVMIRDSLSASAANRAWIAFRPDNAFEGYNHGWTEIYGGGNWETLPRNGAGTQSVPSLPYWVKLERRGNTISTFLSQDGTSWAAGTVGVYNNMPSTAYLGLVVSSLNDGTLNTTTFSNVSITGGDGGGITPPAAPYNLCASASTGQVNLRWLASAGATSYSVKRSTTSGSGYTTIASGLTNQSYTDTSVSTGTTYYYVVAATNSAGTSVNSPEDSATTQSPMTNVVSLSTASASANGSSSSEGAAKAIDLNPGSKWFNGNAGATGWLQCDFGSGFTQTIKRYVVISANDASDRDPKDWQFQGSSDGSNWTTLNTQSGQTFTNRYQANTYPIASPAAYRYYRLNITANNGSSTGIQFSELALLTDQGRTIPDGTYRVLNRKSNKALDVQGGSTTSGAPLVQWGYNGSDSQKWTLTDTGNGQYKIIGLASGKAIDVSGASTSNGAGLLIWPYGGANNQKWTVTPTGDGYFKLTAVHSGKSADVNSGSTADGASIIQWPYGGGTNQQWSISLAP